MRVASRIPLVCLVAGLLAAGPAAHALYGARDATGDEGSRAVRFAFTARGASGECSGSLVGPRAVLTAAHCVRSVEGGDHRVRAVRVGAASPRVVAVTALHVPDAFDAAHPERGHDVAVLTLADAVADRAPLRIAEPSEDPTHQGTRIEIEGFGLVRRGRRLGRPRVLQVASLVYLSPYHCFDGDVPAMARTRMCAAAPDAGVCPGDSGAAATIESGGESIVVGVVSLAIDRRTCSDTATVLSRVSAMRDFLAASGVPLASRAVTASR